MIRVALLLLLGLVARFLPLRLVFWLTERVGDIVYLAWPRGRRWAKEAMWQAVGEDEAKKAVARLARRSVGNYFKYVVEFTRLRWLRPEDLAKGIKYEGVENVGYAMADGQGVILLSLHQGNWDLGGAVLAQHYPLHVVADTHRPARFNTFIQGLRERMGVHVIPVEQAARGVLRVLGRNEVLGIAFDRPGVDNGVEVTFLGRPLRVPAGAAALALRTGARLVPVTLVREGAGKYRGFAAAPILFTPTGEWQQDLKALTQRALDVLEEWVRQYPDQWYVFRPLWGEDMTVNTI
jgi:KDO2-lipid IV(A) lauroyltransferase